MSPKKIYVLCGHAGGGTSMMMRVLQFGGIEIVYKTPERDLKYLNNPYGVFEGWRKKDMKPEDYENLQGKAIKCLGRTFRKIPKEHEIKIIRIERTDEEMLASRKRRRERARQDGLFIDKRSDEVILGNIRKFKRQFEEEYQKRPVQRLDIKFQDMFNDTENQCRRIAEFVECPFDIDKAIKAVDHSLYKRR